MNPSNDDLAGSAIGAAITVHRQLGPDLLESAYEACLAIELSHLKIPFERQKPLPLTYRGQSIDAAYRLDIVIGNELILELKSVTQIEPIHTAQALTYLRLSGLKTDLIINFNVSLLREDIKRVSL